MARTTSFAALRFVGKRFENGLPLETAIELTAYRALVLDVARALFLQRQPHRQRVPRGFESKLELRLREVKEGSALPLLERVVPDATLDGLGNPLKNDIFEKAEGLIRKACTSVQNGGLVDAFPIGSLLTFSKFGKTLEDDEHIELLSGDRRNGARYDKHVQGLLIQEAKERTRGPVDVIGKVKLVDVEKRSAMLSITGKRIPCYFGDMHRSKMIAALAKPMGTLRVQGEGRYDDQLGRLELIESVGLLDPVSEEHVKRIEKLDTRLQELLNLDEGWLDGEGMPIRRRVVESTRTFLRSLVLKELEEPWPSPSIYPTPKGGLLLEWTVGPWEASLEIHEKEHGYFHSLNVDTDKELEGTMKLKAPELRAFIKKQGEMNNER